MIVHIIVVNCPARTVYVNVNNGIPGSATWASGQNRNGAGTAALLVGARDNNGVGEYWDGLIDEAVYYKRILTATDRAWLYNNGAGRSYSDLGLSGSPGTSGLVSWWSMDLASITRSDSHSAANHLTDNNGVGSSYGLKGNAVSFVAAQQKYLSRVDNPSISTGNVDFTLVAQVYLNSAASGVILDKSESLNGNAFDYRLVHNPTTGFRFRVGATAAVDSGAVAVPGWHTVVAWHDSVKDTINIQVDNGVVNAVVHAAGATDTSYPLTIGAYANGAGSWDGRIDEVALYKRVLTASERAWLYNSGQGHSYADLTAPAPATPTTTILTYDRAGRKISMTDPDMGEWTYMYDALGNLTRQTDARGQRICLYYDALNRLTGKYYQTEEVCPANPAFHVGYTYDLNANSRGRRSGMTDASGSTIWTYDARGNMNAEVKTLTGGGTFTTMWTYNAADLPISMLYPDNETVAYDYNSRMLLEKLRDTKNTPSLTDDYYYVSATGYDSAGRIDLRTFGNLTQTDYDYYPWTQQGGRLQYLKSGTTSNPTSLQDLGYSYDAAGNISNLTNTLASETNTYGYDTLNRLTSWTLNSTPETYTYDPASGNLDVKAGVDLNYNDAAHVHAVTHIGTTQKYWYDANGNQTTRIVNGQTINLAYDAENRLVSASGAVTASFVYDGDGKQVKVVVGGITTYYVGAHYQVENGVVTKYYFAGAQRVAMRTGSTLYYLLGDHLGSTSITTNSSGALVAELRYKPWGETRFTSGTTPTNYQYTGQRNEVSLGLYFYNARWYDSYLNHFTQPDTIVPDQYNSQDYDRYSYARNNPIRYTDPTGHEPKCDADGYCGYHPTADSVAASFGVKFVNGGQTWTTAEKLAALRAVGAVARRLSASTGNTAINAFKEVYGPVHFQMGGCGDDCRSRDKNGKPYGDEGGAFSSGWQSNNGDGYWLIKIATMTDDGGVRGMRQMIHELGHTYDYAKGYIRDTMPDNIVNRNSLRPNGYWYDGKFIEQDDAILWQYHPAYMTNGNSKSEIFADMFIAWTLNAWNTSTAKANVDAVAAAQAWMP